MSKEFCIELQETGDIILIKNNAILSDIQRGAQRLATFRYANFSHAILALEKGIYIEAMKNEGVSFFCIDELRERLKKEYSDNWKIVRFKNINKNIQSKILKFAEYFYGQGYNKNFFYKGMKGKHKINSSFCSELIQRIYQKSGISIGKKNQNIWPVYLDSLTKYPEKKWIDVTRKYSKKCSLYFDEENYLRMCNHKQTYTKYFLYINQVIADTSSALNSSQKIIELIIDNVHNIKKPDELQATYGIKNPTFYSTFISPMVSKIRMIRDNNNNTMANLEKPSYLYENLEYPKWNIDSARYDEVLSLSILFYENCIKYVDMYLCDIRFSSNDEFTKSLILVINSHPSYKENHISKSEKAIKIIKTKCSNVKINSVSSQLKMITKGARLINFIKDHKIVSLNNDNIVEAKNKYQEYKINV